jgi:hypothetical protein
MRLIRWIKSLFCKRKKYTDLEKMIMLAEYAHKRDPESEAYNFHTDCGDRD